MDKYIREIIRRGGETEIVGQYGAVHLTAAQTVTISDGLHDGELVLMHAEGWRKYTRKETWRAQISYLCGVDDNGPWAVRVPGTVDTVYDALRWLVPARIQTARFERRKVLRQGDAYAVELRVDHAAKTVPDNCRWDAETRTLYHQPRDGRVHAPLHVPFKCRFVMQRAYQMGRSGRLGAAD